MTTEDENKLETESEEIIEEPSPSTPMVSPGSHLCEVREHLGHNRAIIGQQLGLTEKAVKDLERNHFDRFSSSVYVRGYLKNYAKALGESEEEIMSLYDQYCAENELDAGKSSMKPIPEKSKSGTVLKIIFALLSIAVVVGIFMLVGDA